MDHNINQISAITFVRLYFPEADEEAILARLSMFEHQDYPNHYIDNSNALLHIEDEETIDQYHSRFLLFLDNRPQK